MLCCVVSNLVLRGFEESWVCCRAACSRLFKLLVMGEVGGEELGDVDMEDEGEAHRCGTAFSWVSSVVLSPDRALWRRGKVKEGRR